MGKSYTELKKEFEQEWSKNLKLYIEAGMSQEFIATMRAYDEAAFRKERTFQNKTPSRIEYWDDPRMDNPVEYFSTIKKDLDTQLEDISPGLSQKLDSSDKELLILTSIGYTQAEIGENLHISQQAVSLRFHKLKKLFKIACENGSPDA